MERIAGKDYTTLSAIAKMRELCRVPAKAEISVGPLQREHPICEHTVNFLVQSDVRLNGPLSLRERLRSDCAETDRLNKARPISKRERDALKLCFEARGTPIAL
ncbi:hypothetical protein [Bradyrhizobium sp. CCGB20]|uniref:hypothetical protein n=1 Tax=Bradyrhizobium sp. CCGB20 TaxID=2949633 RepID=UPI0020B1ECFC|nr:hypothetical protein [Bradyrhizobium sp. CCGB20]MCP3400186.1 hypothetical protein [Bradyrhizobium sp. CCGB20]